MKACRYAVSIAAAALTLLSMGAPAFADRHPNSASIDSSTWVDHDGQPVPKPKERDPSLYGYMFRQAIVEPFSHLFDIPDKLLWMAKPFGVERKVHAANENAYDEAPNSTWFTNRNHVKAVPAAEIRKGPFDGVVPTKPWTVTSLKKGGRNIGFQIKDADGRKWLVKLDPVGFPQAGSGAGAIVCRLAWAAGYNLALYQAVTFRREDLNFETKVASTKSVDTGKPPIAASDVDELLRQGAASPDGRHYAGASFFLPGSPAGPPSLREYREDDPNDWYTHKNRRDLRGIYVLYSWLNNWDVKDHQSLDMFTGKDKAPGHLMHYVVDVDGSLGVGAEGAKELYYGYEMRIDPPRIMRRLVTLGFYTDPWRRAKQETGIPSVGNLESEVFDPAGWRPLAEVEPFREITLRDAYWGAKLVASFSDAQIAAAVDAAAYEDPRAPAFLRPELIKRRDKIARYWFDRVAPLDFFHAEGSVLRFRDLALDIGLTGVREYEVEIDSSPESERDTERMRLTTTAMTLPGGDASRLSLTLTVAGSDAAPVRVDLKREGTGWVVTRVRHA